MSEIPQRQRGELLAEIERLKAEHAEALKDKDAEIARLQLAMRQENNYVCQVLGKALGYPQLKDDQRTFPEATEADGVVVEPNTAASLADEAAEMVTWFSDILPTTARLARCRR